MNQTAGLGDQACAVAVVLNSSGDELYHHSAIGATGNREQPEVEDAPSIMMMDEDEAMQLDWDDCDDDDDGDDDSWGLMDQADQEAIQLEELQVQSYEEEGTDDDGEGTETTSFSELSRDGQEEDGESSPHHRALSPAERQGDQPHLDSQHRFIITPERQTASSTYFEVVSTEAAANDDDTCEEQEQPPGASFAFARLAILMRRSDASRRSVVRFQCPTDYFGSSGFFHMEMERQQLRRMMNDC